MKKNMAGYLRRSAAPIAIGVALIASPAFAQDEQLPATDQASSDQGSEIVVTGSRIPQPNLEGTAPVTVVSAQDIKLQGTTRVEDMLNSLPAVFASQASTLANGADGTASVDLRGLGTTRTLSLVNGRRLLPGDPSPTSGSAADINIIPASILKRVEVLTGGASSTYGADAVAGVVNFIIDKDFTGIRVDGQYSLYQHTNNDTFLTPLLDARQKAGFKGFDYPSGSVADGGTVDATISLGTAFDDDRGHALAYFGYRKVKAITQARRDYSACVLQNGGSGANQCGGSATSDNGNVFLWDLNRSTASSTVYTFAPGGGFVGGSVSRYNFAPTNYYQRPDERYTAGFFADYEINDAIKPYAEFMFMDDRTLAQIAPSGDFGNTLTINCDNPLMSTTQRNVACNSDNLINGFLGTFPLAAGAVYNDGTSGTPGHAAPPLVFTDSLGRTYNQGYFQLLRRNVEGGPRISDLQHTSFRGVIGTKGDLGKSWSYDAYYQYGRVEYSQVYSNEFSVARLNRALNAVDEGLERTGVANGHIVCRSVIDGSDPTCVPYNVFAGAGGASAASVAYLSATGFQKGTTSEQIASASVTGLLGDYGVKSPWADDGVAVNLGVEYRKESLDLQTDNAFSTGDLTGQGGATLPLSGSFKVFEFFGEAQVPIVHNSFIYDLSLNAGYRRSSYDTSVGKSYDTDTWKIGVDFAPIRDIRFRGAYNRAARAPNIQELFATPTVGLNGSSDPCAGHPIDPSSNQGDYGCVAQGLHVGQGTASNPAAQYNGLIGGNPNLTPEIATTKTVGVVLQPSFIPGLSVTVDYFDIKIKDTISSTSQDAVLADCSAKATATFTPYSCSLIHRDAAGSLWLTPTGYVDSIPTNLGSVQTKGIEVAGNYSMGIGSLGKLSLSMNGTYLKEYKVDNGVTDIYDCAGLYGPTCSAGGTTAGGAPLPKWRHKARATFQMDNGVGVSLQWRYIGSVNAETLETNESLYGGIHNNFGPGLHIKSYSYFDLATTMNLGSHYTFRLGVNNILDKQPPYVTSGGTFGADGKPIPSLCPTGPCNGNTYPATYDALGRYLYAGVTLDF
ncbi:TonB-dependent receptor [Sphingomonas sp.]|uniref:TonB-dependent receptor domain-containing protein n=1 Tax=Sphingomonas sp. TaxID=28214 RepID=UPI001B1F0DE0|nr:TonB-dependent receptor [Sphingomonas sp.]MBO9713132.1 TonB-dependent receptor [Sphingomonas sp.]